MLVNIAYKQWMRFGKGISPMGGREAHGEESKKNGS